MRTLFTIASVVALLAIWILSGEQAHRDQNSISKAGSEAELSAAAASSALDADLVGAQPRAREAVGPEMVRFEVIAVLPNGDELIGPVVRYYGPKIAPNVAAESAHGGTWLSLEEGSEVALEVMTTMEGVVYEGHFPLHEATSETVLVPLESTCSIVRGTITRAGSPVSGITVWIQESVIELGNSPALIQTTTDESGAFKLIANGRLEGELRVGTAKQAKVTIGRGIDPEFRQALQVETGEERVIHVELEPGALTLLVTDHEGRPRAHAAYVSLLKIQSSVGEQAKVTRTLAADNEGKIRFVGLEAGDYWALIRGFENRPTPPRRVRVYHPGGDHEVEVRTPGFAKLRVTTKARVDGEWKSVPSQVWVVERDGVPYQVWDENLQSGWVTELDAEVEPLVHRVSPGVLRLRAGAPEIGFGEAVVSLPEGADESIVIELANPGVKLTIEDPSGRLQGVASLQFSDPQGRLLASRRLAFGRQPVGAVGSAQLPLEVTLPEAGPVVAFSVDHTGPIMLGKFYLHEQGSVWVVPTGSTSH